MHSNTGSVAALGIALLTGALHAQPAPLSDAPPAAAAAPGAAAEGAAPVPDTTLTFNIGVVSDYRYRGISQTRRNPAVQGGIDFSHKSGFYLGTWVSNINWIKDNGTFAAPVRGPIEWDIYGGYKGEITKELTYDIGYLRYQYPGNTLERSGGGGLFKNANTDELYAALSYSLFTVKYSYALSNLFGQYDYGGLRNTRGSGYLEASANIDLGHGFTLVPHVGRQSVRNLSVASYTDYALTLNKDFGQGFSASVAAVGTDASRSWYVNPATGQFMGKTALALGAKYTF